MTVHTAPRRPVIPFAAAFPLALLLLTGCSRMMYIPQEVQPVQAWNMIRMNSTNPDLVIIDVRTEEEFDREHIPRAINLNVQSPSFRRDIESLDRGKTYLLYCRSGVRSDTALEIMKSAGFTKAAVIVGGFNAWTRAGLRTVSTLDEL